MKKDNILIYFFLNHSLWVNPSGNSVDVIDYTQLIILARWPSLGTLVTTSRAMVKRIIMPVKLNFPFFFKLNFPIKLRIWSGTLAHAGNPSIPKER